MNVHPLHDNMYLVKSGSNPNKEYLVATDENDGRGECQCIGYSVKKTCKHIKAAREFDKQLKEQIKKEINETRRCNSEH